MLPEVAIKHRLTNFKLLQLSNCSSKHAEQKEYFTVMTLSRQLTIFKLTLATAVELVITGDT